MGGKREIAGKLKSQKMLRGEKWRLTSVVSCSQNHLHFPGHDLGIGDGGDLDLPPESDGSFPVPGPEIDTGAIAVVPGATAGATAGLPGTGVQNTSNYSDFLSSCSQEQAFSLCSQVCWGLSCWPFGHYIW